MTDCELSCWRENWNKIVLEGRKPGLTLRIGCDGEELTQREWGHRVFAELRELAELMDAAKGGDAYQQCCTKLESWFEDPSKTFSARLLDEIKTEQGIGKVGLAHATSYKEALADNGYRFYNDGQFVEESADSLRRQQAVESADVMDFDVFLADYFKDIR